MTASPYPPSPVPSDDDLWDCELPFTAFGQFGRDRIDLRVFDQDVYWVDRHGHPHLLVEMSGDYLRAVIGHLLDNADYFHLAELRRRTITMLTDMAAGRIPAEVLAGELGEPRLTEITPADWLESTPLLRRLRRLT